MRQIRLLKQPVSSMHGTEPRDQWLILMFGLLLFPRAQLEFHLSVFPYFERINPKNRKLTFARSKFLYFYEPGTFERYLGICFNALLNLQCSSNLLTSPVTACNRPLYETLLLNRDTASATVVPTKMQELVIILNSITNISKKFPWV